ncbi:xyloglucan endotransglucosylase/hydrolase protein 24 [Phtheirospermum japonicum]|uniref:Xyloglucan endotransglucosylase/hydrolase n=1 Tax=Phtheirospermum japonicum TaxID=374723 RepID=A0A830C0S5_9LAMI|nr:xyloglucan endotransglucosylase/hydrolase protein 24 [Phtheirospermum japonicum]
MADFFSNLQAPLLSFLVLLSCFTAPSAANFHRDAEITWGDGRGKIIDAGRGLSLTLDQYSGSGFQSKNEYLFGRFDMQLKLVPGNSAGTVTTFFEKDTTRLTLSFLATRVGSLTPCTQTCSSKGKGDKEQQFHLWFDPTAAFHTYSIVWNPQRIIFLVDNSPIRVFNNHESSGVAFPNSKPMRVYCSLWNADDWATQGGRIKTDWTKAPFVAYYRNFKIDAQSQAQDLDANGRNRLRWVQQKHMVYNYCADSKRFRQGTSIECKRSRF